MNHIQRDHDRPPASNRLKNIFFTVTITTAFVLGLYSLFLASANAGKVQPSNLAGLLRTATPADSEKIEIALGDLFEQDLIYMVLHSMEVGLDPEVEIAARRAAQALTDSGMAVSVRLLGPRDPDFTVVVAQNGIDRFPAVLVVKKDGGIVLVTDELNEKNLLHVYQRVWGKSSSCNEASSSIY